METSQTVTYYNGLLVPENSGIQNLVKIIKAAFKIKFT